MLVSFWSPKGGTGTSVLAAACAVVLARHTKVRLADLDGDQPAILGASGNIAPGLSEWLLAGPEAPADALDRLEVDVGGHVALLPAGDRATTDASPEAGAALGVVLATDERLTIADAGLARTVALQAVVEVSDVSVLVLRDCYLAVRRAVAHPLTVHASGVVVVTEGRALEARHIVDVLRLPLLGEVPLRSEVARAVDAGVLPARLPKGLERPARRVVERLGLSGRAGRAA
jgi:hypothetical protein